MRRRELVFLLSGPAITWPLAALTQQKATPVIGYLGISDANNPGARASTASFRQGLSEAGYLEGHNLAMEYRYAEGRPERFPDLAAELVNQKVDVIVTAGGTLAALAAKRATTTIPIVFAGVGDPIAEGLVAALARPGGNITGLSFVQTDLIGKWLQLIKEVVPEILCRPPI